MSANRRRTPPSPPTRLNRTSRRLLVGVRWDRCSSKAAVCCHHTSTTCANLRGRNPRPAQSQAFAQLALANLAAILPVGRASSPDALPAALCLLPGRPDAREPLPPKRSMAYCHASKYSYALDPRSCACIGLNALFLLPPIAVALTASRQNLLDQAGVYGKQPLSSHTSSASPRSIEYDYGRRRERCCSRSAEPWRKRRAPMAAEPEAWLQLQRRASQKPSICTAG
ncbi:hypothetical protein V8C44DRAFT_147643 [Trichoderma aethiopicum]